MKEEFPLIQKFITNKLFFELLRYTGKQKRGKWKKWFIEIVFSRLWLLNVILFSSTIQSSRYFMLLLYGKRIIYRLTKGFCLLPDKLGPRRFSNYKFSKEFSNFKISIQLYTLNSTQLMYKTKLLSLHIKKCRSISIIKIFIQFFPIYLAHRGEP